MKQPFISIIVPVKNIQRTLDVMFEYLLDLDYPKDKLEIIMADGGSSDDTVNIIKNWQKMHAFIHFVQVPNCPSPGHARNAAIKMAKAEYLLFTDGDCAPNKDWAKKLLAPFFEDETIGGVGGEIDTLRVAPDSLTEAYCEHTGFLSVKSRSGLEKEGYMAKLDDMSPSQASAHRAPFFATANAAYTKKAIDAIGGSFWDHPTGEDVEFSVRIQQAGFRLYFCPSARIRHMHRIDLDSFLKQWYGYGQGHAFLVEKHATNNFEIVFQIFPGLPSIKIPSKKKGLVYLGNYHMICIFSLFFIISAILTSFTGSNIVMALTCITFLILSYYMYKFFGCCLKMSPKRHFFTWCKIRWFSNTAFIKGGLDGTQKTGILYIEPSW